MRLSICLACAWSLLAVVSCIKPEPLNSEADITWVGVPEGIFLRNPIITNDRVTVYVKEGADLTAIAPTFELTEGATLSPASGTKLDFSRPQIYTVTSQDGNWRKKYTMEFLYLKPVTEFKFDTFRYPQTDGESYHILTYTDSYRQEHDWCSANSAFRITNSSASAVDYPTSYSPQGLSGGCVKLTTLSTGKFGAMFKAPMAAGNLFLGSFELDLGSTSNSTRFGVPFFFKPLSISGYYKYRAGEKFTDKDMLVLEGRRDMFALYAVLFEVTPGVPCLDGTNILTHDNVIMTAVMPEEERVETQVWRKFDLNFTLRDGKIFDPAKMAAGSYSLTIVFSSSKDADLFECAEGSTLMVDELQLTFE